MCVIGVVLSKEILSVGNLLFVLDHKQALVLMNQEILYPLHLFTTQMSCEEQEEQAMLLAVSNTPKTHGSLLPAVMPQTVYT